MTPIDIPFTRLLRVETRKLFDTRSGLILAVSALGLALVAVVARGLTSEPRWFTLAGTAAISLGTLLPVLAILTVTGEWRHRTALTTFALEPRRGRVLAAKCLPPLAVTVAGCVFALLAALPMTAVAAAVHGVEATWAVAPAKVLGWIATMVLVTGQGLGMGLVLLNAPAAIVICLASTALWSTVARLGDMGAILAGWLDLNLTTNPLMNGGLTGDAALRLTVSVFVWIVVPVAAGILRISRKEIG
ncbi:ABC transporter permease [Streptosporangium canum]|uniref:ABC transporter permease n=1 Tax=Streptosporangium canum TaxID=324952 RepID=UPI0036B5A927